MAWPGCYPASPCLLDTKTLRASRELLSCQPFRLSEYQRFRRCAGPKVAWCAPLFMQRWSTLRKDLYHVEPQCCMRPFISVIQATEEHQHSYRAHEVPYVCLSL